MHQQTYCHTLPKPFSKIFFFRIYVPTIHSADIEFDETSDRLTHISAPIQHPQTNPPTTQSTKSPRPYDPQTNPPTTTDAQTKPQIPHSTNTTTIQPPQTHTAPQTHNDTHAHSTQARPPTQTLTPSHREAMPYLDVDAQPASSGLTVRPSGRTRRRSTDAVAGQMQSQPSQSDRPGIRQDQAKPDQTRSGQDIDTAFAETSRQVSANFSAKPDHKSIRDAMRAVPMPSMLTLSTQMQAPSGLSSLQARP